MWRCLSVQANENLANIVKKMVNDFNFHRQHFSNFEKGVQAEALDTKKQFEQKVNDLTSSMEVRVSDIQNWPHFGPFCIIHYSNSCFLVFCSSRRPYNVYFRTRTANWRRVSGRNARLLVLTLTLRTCRCITLLLTKLTAQSWCVCDNVCEFCVFCSCETFDDKLAEIRREMEIKITETQIKIVGNEKVAVDKYGVFWCC